MGRMFGRSKAKAALARANTIEIDVLGDYEDDRQKFQSLVQHFGVEYTGNSVDSSDIDDRVTALEAGGALIPITTKTTNYTVTISDRMILGDATSSVITFTLPQPSTAYSGGGSIWLSLSKIDNSSNAVVIEPYGSETIAGNSSFSLLTRNEVLSLITDGNNWFLKD